MSLISDIEQRVLARLEDPSGVYWDLQNEVRPAIVEGINEATLITGEPEIRSGAMYTITANTTAFPMPSAAFCLISMEGAGGVPIRKLQVWDLDQKKPTWENDTADVVKYWFPIGLTMFGVYPKLTADSQVVLTYVGIPVTAARPYTGTEVIPFQAEYDEGLEEYAAHVLRVKEGSLELFQSLKQYGRYLDRMAELSRFAVRKDALRFSRVTGPPVKVSNVEEV